MYIAARLTASISDCDAVCSLSYSSLRQREMLRLAHLLSFCASSHEQYCSMKVCGSGCVIVVVNICMSAQNFW
jgi:hypothetical protein